MNVHLGDIGTIFELTILDSSLPVDISTATATSIVFKKPNNSTTTKVGTFLNTGSDGKIKYIAELGLLDATGQWKIQAKITMPAGIWYSSTEIFTVLPNL